MAGSSDEEASDPSSMELMKRDTEEQFTSIYDVSEKRRVTLIEAFFVMVGYNIGTGILILPFSIRQIGLVGWLCTVLALYPIQYACAYMLNKSTYHVMEEQGGLDVSRDAYQAISGESGGPKLRKLSVVVIYVATIVTFVGMLLVAATILDDLVPVPKVDLLNRMRLWATIIMVLLTPVSYLGTFSDLNLPAIIASVAAFVSGLAIIINCLLYRYILCEPGDLVGAKKVDADQIYFIAIGTLMFTACVPLTVPNLTAIAAEPKQLYKPILGSYVYMVAAYYSTAIIVYMTFGDHSLPSTITTFYQVMKSVEGRQFGSVFKYLTILIQVLMLIHLGTGLILLMNPVYLHLEEVFKVPRKFTIKRVAVRTSLAVLVILLSIAFPMFQSVVDICGGVPMTFLNIFLPLIIYINLFHPHMYQKILAYVLLLGIAVLIAGNLIASVYSIVKSYSSI